MTKSVPVSTNGVPARPRFREPQVAACPGCGFPRSEQTACPWCRTQPNKGFAPGLPYAGAARDSSGWNAPVLAGSGWNSRDF
jgi:hypothetical protein